MKKVFASVAATAIAAITLNACSVISSPDVTKLENITSEIKVCEIATEKIITIKEVEFTPTIHSKDLSECKAN